MFSPRPNSEESPTKKQKVSVESEDSGAEEEDDVLAPLAPAPVKGNYIVALILKTIYRRIE